ncbi:hypothetical protein AMTR_s00161p00055170 [Amborella trichopoda]|uniref:Aminotransferase-like plant mobile domain-containing protein n=1 Tax=Amborella trichopoda TaxID=13333 RepID=W1PRZ9_AMBTC|nr:hypothetical protein AMTR_s00161p00055170 [Amborella trichopoda]
MMYLLSVRAALLPLRIGVQRYIELYNPHRFSRQHRIDQVCHVVYEFTRWPNWLGSCIKIVWDSCTCLGLGRQVIIPHYSKEVYKTYTYCLWNDNHQRGFHKTLLTKLPSMREDGTSRTHYKSKITNVDVKWATRTRFPDNWNIVNIERPVGNDPWVSNGHADPFIQDLNAYVEAEAAHRASALVENSKGKREAMNPSATRGRLAHDLLSKKKMQERSSSPTQDEYVHKPLAKRKSPSPQGDQMGKRPNCLKVEEEGCSFYKRGVDRRPSSYEGKEDADRDGTLDYNFIGGINYGGQ